MIAIDLRFPAGGRYHATAWGTHVNEGVPEWPPSPWRLLRALIAAARWKSGAPTCEDPPRLRPLIEALAAAPPPRYVLPPASAAHTRHYLPLGNLDRAKAFDTFVHPSAGASVKVVWAVALEASLREYLAALLARINYLGRAESLCEAELLPVDAPVPTEVDAFPCLPGAPTGPDQEYIRLLGPVPPDEYHAWVQPRLAEAGKKRGIAKPRAGLPPVDLFAALHCDTSDWRDAGWSQPPGSRWVEYVRPANPFRLAAPPAAKLRGVAVRASEVPTVARFAVQTPLPEAVTSALSIGERFHEALCSRSDAATVFSGMRDGLPLAGHDHAYYLPEVNERGQITHVLVVARMGFDPDAMRALQSLRATWARGNSPGLKCLLLGTGGGKDFPDATTLATSRIWTSLTPFIPVRHLQRSRNGKPRLDAGTGLIRGSPEHDLRRLLRENGLPDPTKVETLDALELPACRLRWLQFQRERRHGGGTGVTGRPGFGFRLTFDQPVTGPLALGYGAHFGLGLFVPDFSFRRASADGEWKAVAGS